MSAQIMGSAGAATPTEPDAPKGATLGLDYSLHGCCPCCHSVACVPPVCEHADEMIAALEADSFNHEAESGRGLLWTCPQSNSRWGFVVLRVSGQFVTVAEFELEDDGLKQEVIVLERTDGFNFAGYEGQYLGTLEPTLADIRDALEVLPVDGETIHRSPCEPTSEDIVEDLLCDLIDRCALRGDFDQQGESQL